jgi:hypothetical protein
MGLSAFLNTVAKRKIPNPSRESNPNRPARSSVAISELSQLQYTRCI